MRRGQIAARAEEPTGERLRATPEGRDRFRRLLEQVTGQLGVQLALDAPGAPTLVLLPVVGFGGQSSRMIAATLDCLRRQRVAGTDLAVALLVNRPASQPPDATAVIASRIAERMREADEPVQLAIATVALEGRPRLGELRQLLLEAAQALKPDGDLIAVVADDDVVSAPDGYIERIRQGLACGKRDLVLGPVLFDDPRLPSVLLPDFFLGDVLRALLAARWVDRLARLDLGRPDDRVEAERLSRSWFESIVLSTYLGVRAGALERSGGFHDLNEITNLARSVQARALTEAVAERHSGRANAIAGAWSPDANAGDALGSLTEAAVCVSSRRALHAVARGRSASVEQWRACRFRASRIDQVRLMPLPALEPTAIARLRRTDREGLVESIEQVAATTLAYFPPDSEISATCLDDLELGRGRCTVVTRDETSCLVRIRDAAPLLSLLEARQAKAIERSEQAEQRGRSAAYP